MKQRNGVVVAKLIQNTTNKTLQGFIHDNVTPRAAVYTDQHISYKKLTGYTRGVINHSVGEHVKLQVHTNGIENFWALRKRRHYGVYHYMSGKYLHRYVYEFSCSHNKAGYGTMQFISETLKNTNNRRLAYKELTDA